MPFNDTQKLQPPESETGIIMSRQAICTGKKTNNAYWKIEKNRLW